MRPRLWTTVLLFGVTACASCEAESRTVPPDTSTLTAAQWTAGPDAPSARTEVTAAVSGTSIVVTGGMQADGGSVTSVEIFDTATRRWSAGPPLPLAVNHAMSATVDGAVYVLGGYLSDGTPSAAAFRLDGLSGPAGVSAPGGAAGSAGSAGASAAGPAGPRWRSVADLPSARAAGAAAAIGRRIYVAAGIGPGRDVLADSTLVYDTATDSWSAAPGPPTRREHLGGAGSGGLLYTVGGRTAKGGNLATVESYDPAAGTWTRRPDLPTARGGLAAAASCNGMVIAVGGEGRRTFPQVEIFTPGAGAAGSWSALPPLPDPRHGLGVVMAGQVLYTLSGGPEPGLHVAATTQWLDLLSLGRCDPAPS
jgi:non-specific serine/threonine protein kinase